jgi:hypothetical protein
MLKGLLGRGVIDPKVEEGKIRREIRRVIEDELKVGEGIDEAVRRKLHSLSRKLVEGSPEWEVMYQKYFAEEEVRRGRSTT